MQKNSKGFSLLELILVLLLITLAFFPLLQTLISNLKVSYNLDKTTLALNLAQAKLEEARGTSFDLITSTTKESISGFPELSQQMLATSEAVGLKMVTVFIFWSLPEGEQSIQLCTYICSQESTI